MTVVERYEDAHPRDRWTLEDGYRAWMRGDECQACGLPMATDGKSAWCTGGCNARARKALGVERG